MEINKIEIGHKLGQPKNNCRLRLKPSKHHIRMKIRRLLRSFEPLGKVKESK